MAVVGVTARQIWRPRRGFRRWLGSGKFCSKRIKRIQFRQTRRLRQKWWWSVWFMLRICLTLLLFWNKRRDDCQWWWWDAMHLLRVRSVVLWPLFRRPVLIKIACNLLPCPGLLLWRIPILKLVWCGWIARTNSAMILASNVVYGLELVHFGKGTVGISPRAWC